MRTFQVDAFTSRPFSGNPATVVLDAIAQSDEQYAKIAREFAHAETVFVLLALMQNDGNLVMYDASPRVSSNVLSFGFPPIASPQARVLILGTLPGRLSIDLGEYYANPLNAFWRIMAAGIPDLRADYAGRVAMLSDHGIAVWDVLAAATRSGSLDSAIATDAIPNNFRAFFQIHPNVRLVCFNGVAAGDLYEKHVLRTLTEPQRAIAKRTLPSTSGAHARLTLAQKAAQWSILWTFPVDR